MRKWLTLACILCASSVAAQAQPGPAEAPLQWAEIETIRADSHPGPAVWRVSKGDSEVWIIATVGPQPKDLTFNTQYLSELLDGARALITPAGFGVGLGDGLWLLINYGGRLSLPRGQALEAILDEPMRARFIALRTSLGRNEDRYRTDSPLRAALRLFTDFRDHAQLTGDAFGRINRLARDRHVPSKPAAENGSAYDALRDLLTLPVDKQRVCLGRAIEDVTWLSGHAEAAAQAWAVGDVRTVKANLNDQLDPLDCMTAAVGSLAQIRARATTAQVDAIAAALDQPGKTIALLGMGELLRKGGVLEQLEARGLTIEGPAE